MLVTLARMRGAEATLETMEVLPQGDFFDERAEGAADWVADVAADVMPRLMEMRLSETYVISERAYIALIQIAQKKAVSAEDRSTILRTLISDIDDPDHYAGQVLRYIASGYEDGYYWSNDGRFRAPGMLKGGPNGRMTRATELPLGGIVASSY